MEQIKTIARWVVSIPLMICGFAVFNEGESFLPNIIGLACWFTLFYLHRDKKSQNK